MKRERLPDLIAEIDDEMKNLAKLVNDIKAVCMKLPTSPDTRRIYDESLALKLHNFYTGCERIFQGVAEDINGGVPPGQDWHKRLLRNMTLEVKDIRPALITKKTAAGLEEFLAFRHVVRNIYGFELDPDRLARLTGRVEEVFNEFKKDICAFSRLLEGLV